MGQISCFSKLSMLFIFRPTLLQIHKTPPTPTKMSPLKLVKVVKSPFLKAIYSQAEEQACCSCPSGCGLLSRWCQFCFQQLLLSRQRLPFLPCPYLKLSRAVLNSCLYTAIRGGLCSVCRCVVERWRLCICIKKSEIPQSCDKSMWRLPEILQ